MANSRIATSSITQGFPKSKSLLAGNDAIYAGSYESIATVTVGAGGSSTITFSSIPNTYTHLQIRAISRSGTAGESGGITFNSDSAQNYTRHFVYGNGTSAASGSGINANNIDIFQLNASTTTASVFSGNILDILDYKDTSKYKTVRLLAGGDYNGTGFIGLYSGFWRSTSAITSITITPSSSVAQYSSFALYGIK